MRPITPLDLLCRAPAISRYVGPDALLIWGPLLEDISYFAPEPNEQEPEFAPITGRRSSYDRIMPFNYCRPDSRRRYR